MLFASRRVHNDIEQIKALLRTCKPMDPRADKSMEISSFCELMIHLDMTDDPVISEYFLRLSGGRSDAREVAQYKYILKLKEEVRDRFVCATKATLIRC